MTQDIDYLYRVVYRVKDSHWDLKQDPAKNVWRVHGSYSSGTRPYTTIGPAKSMATRMNNRNSRYEYKVQRLPANNWQFI